jgi:hypothetical protein
MPTAALSCLREITDTEEVTSSNPVSPPTSIRAQSELVGGGEFDGSAEYVQNHFPIGQPEFLASRSLGEVKAAKKDLCRGAQPGVRRVRTSSSATRISLVLLFWETRRRTLKACSGSMV